MLRILSKWFAVLVFLILAAGAFAQDWLPAPAGLAPISTFDDGTALRAPEVDPAVLAHAVLPVVAPDLALRIFESQGQQQSAALRGYTDDTLIIAELADTSQRGAFELRR